MTINNSFGHDSRPRVAVTSISFVKSTVLCDELKRAFPATHFNETGSHLSEFELIEFLKKADAAVAGRENINDRTLSKASWLKIISKYGVGLDNIDEFTLEYKNYSP